MGRILTQAIHGTRIKLVSRTVEVGGKSSTITHPTVGEYHAGGSGHWYCVTHAKHFADQLEKDFHIFGNKNHQLAWICHEHGVEQPTANGLGDEKGFATLNTIAAILLLTLAAVSTALLVLNFTPADLLEFVHSFTRADLLFAIKTYAIVGVVYGLLLVLLIAGGKEHQS